VSSNVAKRSHGHGRLADDDNKDEPISYLAPTLIGGGVFITTTMNF
jgi:hypothetical protein